MIVEFPLFGAGINYFPYEISVLRIFEPRYLLLIGDSIKNNQSFCVSKSLDNIGQIVSEVQILEHQDISNAEQVVVVECGDAEGGGGGGGGKGLDTKKRTFTFLRPTILIF